jgi:hypothetical protein
LKVHHDQHVHQHDREDQTAEQRSVGALHGGELAAEGNKRTPRKMMAVLRDDARDI